ncbi:MAG: dihydroorotase [Legionellales bacterium]|nr:dihydroorotase [Legionellales bacterium]|tara:strand:- start:12294 stop:13577 length:1284 start_codon:yes stop_codon:yes gene_type:complete
MTKILINNGLVVCPKSDIEHCTNVYIADGKIVAVADELADFSADHTIDATDMIVSPGLIDLCADLREPGFTYKATIASETSAAAQGGITQVCCTPMTNPVIDNSSVVEQILQRAKTAGQAKVLPIAALTQGLEGKYLSSMASLKQAGCVAVSNGRNDIVHTNVLRNAFAYAATQDLLVILQPEDVYLSQNGFAHEGKVSTRLGIPGIPSCAETIAVARAIELVKQTGVHCHFSKLSTSGAVDLIHQAKQAGLPVTADVSINHLHLSDIDISDFSPLCYVQPPLRSSQDQTALLRGLQSGIIDAICSDHQPHELDAKLAPFSEAEPGISGLDTLLALVWRLQDTQQLSLSQAIASLTAKPAAILGIEAGCLSPNTTADICIIDPHNHWVVASETLASKGKNTPFMGWEMPARVAYTLVDGEIIWQSNV